MRLAFGASIHHENRHSADCLLCSTRPNSRKIEEPPSRSFNRKRFSATISTGCRDRLVNMNIESEWLTVAPLSWRLSS
ncbi:hypothetical protein Nepgr_019454 [Nepenthes gracilis]|uniref:Uncharacterized protein n=1 Tax=Nepenthes gracilis TaxID=150966 RepID=A0AAD3STH7_NEPGR|nr:hypothetical protein Nepgr_019454 [Nepenthes gracilis]